MNDWRDIENGRVIPTEGMKYTDQPYAVRLADGRWLCMMTVGTLGETVRGSENYSAVTISADRGRTWTPFVRCNRSYAVPLVTPSGRVYSLTPRFLTWSDDGGKSWSAPMIISAFAEGEPENGPGHEDSGWSVAMPVVHEGAVILPWARIGLSKPPRKTEVFFTRSKNLLGEANPSKIRWERLPSGEVGLRGPDWDKPENRSEEAHLVVLSDGTLYAVWRTDQGYIGHAKSRDGGKTWTKSAALTYQPGGRIIKHPLACPSLWKCANGKFLLWHHNHGIDPKSHYSDRNPAWISGGVEIDTAQGKDIRWSEPEILLYSDDLTYDSGRISYPGFMEDNGRYYIFETQKTVARMHEIPATLLEAVWSQHERKGTTRDGLVLELGKKRLVTAGKEVSTPSLPIPSRRGGFSIELWLTLHDIKAGKMVLDTRNPDGVGILVTTAQDAALRLDLNDGNRAVGWSSDPGLLKAGHPQHVVFVVDGGPKLITVLVNGKLCDGSDARRHGYGRLDDRQPSQLPGRTTIGKPDLGDVTGGPRLRIGSADGAVIHSLRLYNRHLLTSEAIGNYRAGHGSDTK